MEKTRERRRQSDVEPEAAPELPSRSFSEMDVGRIMTIATQLQLQQKETTTGQVGESELKGLARELGISEECLEKAIRLAGEGEASLSFDAGIATVRDHLLRHFAQVNLALPGKHGNVPPRIARDGENAVEVRWADRLLRLELEAADSGLTIVRWKCDPGASARRAAVIAAFTVATIIGMIFTGLAGSSIPALVAVLLTALVAAVAGARDQVRHDNDEFAKFCLSHLQNLQLIVASRHLDQ